MLQELIENQILIADYRQVTTDARCTKDIEELLMRRFQSEYINDSLDQLVAVLFQKFSHDFVVILQNFIESCVDGVFLELDGVVEDDIQPLLTDIDLRDWVVFDDLPNEIVSTVEDCL